MEIIIGTSQNLSVIDIKNESLDPNYFWYTYRGNNKRDGVYVFNGSISGDINIDGSLNVQDLVVLINKTVVAYGETSEVFTPENITSTFGGMSPDVLFGPES